MAQVANWQVANWYERKFDFSFPVELYPDLCMRLRGTPARLEELVRGCAARRMVRAAEGKWSAQEHAGHLLDLEPLWMARVEDYVAGGSELSVADLSNRGTFEAKYLMIARWRGFSRIFAGRGLRWLIVWRESKRRCLGVCLCIRG